jgi:hypothetical protein
MTQSNIDFDGLLEVLRAGKENPHLKMEVWGCNTSACLIGSFCKANQNDNLHISSGYPQLKTSYFPIRNSGLAISVRFGITIKEAEWLFIATPFGDTKYNPLLYRQDCPINLKPDQAIARLEKFIRYKLHKEGTKQVVGRNKMLIDYGKFISGRKSAVYASAV